MYRNQFRPDRFNDNTNAARRTGRGFIGGTHHWVVAGGRGSAAPGARSPPNRSGRPGTVQQYRPRSPASVVPQGNATNYTPVVSAADEHTKPVNRGSLESQKSSNAPDQSDVVNLESSEGPRAEDSLMPTIHSEGYSSSAFTLQFGTLSPGVITKQCIPCSTSAPPDLSEKKHEKCQAHHGPDEPNVVSMPSAGEQQKQETTDNLIICSQADSIDTYDNVPAMLKSNSCVLADPELPQTPGLYYVAPAEKVSMDSCKVFPRNPSSPTHQQWQKQDTRKDAINASQSDTMHNYPATNPKMSVQIPPPYTPNMAPPSFMLPVNGRPLPAAFQQKQPQVPVEFRGQGVPMGNAPHVPPFFVHGAQPRALQPPAFVHQGQGLGCAPPACPHLPQLGNMRITQELPQQRSCDEQKRPIRITHPDTHEELMLDRRGHSYIDSASGAMPLHNMNQLAQPVTTFPPLQNVYYRPNMYSTGHIYLPTTNAPPASTRQMCPRMQTPRHSFDPNINNQAVTSISPPMQNPWVGASSRPPTNLRSASEVSSSKGVLPSDVYFPGQGALKPPTIFLAENNELSSQTSTPTCAEETPALLRYSDESALSSQQRVHKLGLEISPQSEKLVSEANLKLPAATSGISCSTSPQSVLTQQAQTGSALVDRVTSIAGPQNISACKLTSTCVASGTSSVEAKSLAMESSAVPSATSSSGAKGQLYHIVPQSEILLDTESKNSKYDGNSILGKPPLIYTQESLPPKSPTTSIFPESLKARVNHVPLPETSEANCSAPLQMQDMMREEHMVNAEVTCSESKAEQVDMTMPMPGASSRSGNGTDVSKLVNVPTCAESGDLHLSLHTGNVSRSDKNNGSSSDVQIGSCSLNDLDNESIPMIMASVSNSTSVYKKIERESIDSVVPNQCSVADASMVQTKKPVLEAAKPKTTHGRRKKRKEVLPKSSHIYTAEAVVQSSSTVNKEICTLDAEMGSSAGSNDNQNKNDIFDWEGDMEISRDEYGFC